MIHSKADLPPNSKKKYLWKNRQFNLFLAMEKLPSGIVSIMPQKGQSSSPE
jgi:hypothetical protein